jgi:hypothetical protein
VTDPVLAEVIDPSVLKARRAARAARDLADTLADARREAMDAERSALAALRTAATHAQARTTRLATLEAELAAARQERDVLDARLGTERRIREDLERRLAAEEAQRAALSDELRSVRAAHEAFAEGLEGVRAERDRLPAQLREARSRTDEAMPRGPAREPDSSSVAPPAATAAAANGRAAGSAGSPPAAAPANAGTTGSAHSASTDAPANARTTESSGSPAPASLQALAAQQVAAAAARAQGSAGSASASASAVAADLERAAAALRARTAGFREQDRAGEHAADVPPGTGTPDDAPLAPRASDPDRPSATRGPAGGVLLGESPSLRSVLARFAHGNPAAAGILLAGLLPAQGRLVRADLDYDLTIRGTGTYAVTLSGGTASVRSLAAPRGRPAADLQLTAEPAALAELLLGSRRRVGRLNRDLRFRGPRRRLDLLEPVVHAELSLADAVRAGAQLDPVAALLAMAVAVPARWTRGHRFTVEHVIGAGQVRRVFLHARDGAGLHAATSFGGRPDATIRLTPETFHALLRDERPAPGLRPHVRGDRTAVAALRTWAVRVLGR